MHDVSQWTPYDTILLSLIMEPTGTFLSEDGSGGQESIITSGSSDVSIPKGGDESQGSAKPRVPHSNYQTVDLDATILDESTCDLPLRDDDNNSSTLPIDNKTNDIHSRIKSQDMYHYDSDEVVGDPELYLLHPSNKSGNAALTKTVSPEYKDQVHRRQEGDVAAVVGDSSSVPIVLDVQHAQSSAVGMSPSNADEIVPVYDADAFALKGFFFVNRRLLILLVAAVAVTIIVMGSVCGTGLCGRSRGKMSIATLSSFTPSASPSSAPKLGPELIERVRFSSSTTPLLFSTEGSKTAEGRALQWLLEEDPLSLSPQIASDED